MDYILKQRESVKVRDEEPYRHDFRLHRDKTKAYDHKLSERQFEIDKLEKTFEMNLRYRTPDLNFGPKFESSYINQRITERENKYK